MIRSLTSATRQRLFTDLEQIAFGRLRLRTPEGDWHSFGDGDGPEAVFELNDWSLLPALALRGDVALGEGYVEGIWQTDDLEQVLQLLLRNLDSLNGWGSQSPLARLKLHFADRVLRANSRRGASRNIRAHYDVGNEFYHLWLDPGMSYSSALFETGDDLETAQARKNERILSRLGGGDRTLEIGCGWGGFAEAAADRGRHVTGLTLSPAQAGYADARLDGRAEIRLQDYRDCRGSFDNIVSVEMGEAYWPTYFAAIRDRLKRGGKAVIQAITVPDQQFSIYRRRSDYIRRYIFPGGLLPCHSALNYAAGQAGLQLRDSFSFGPHYAKTCRIWASRMQAATGKILSMGHDERFIRNWQFYLSGCAATFATGRTDVVQMEFAG